MFHLTHFISCNVQRANDPSEYGEERFSDLERCRLSNVIIPDLKDKGFVGFIQNYPRTSLQDADELEFRCSNFFSTPELSISFKNLTHLKFEECDMRCFKLESLTKFLKLFYLSLNNNNITRVPAEFACFPNLVSLSMSNNKISLVEQGFLDKLVESKLSYIDLRANGHIDICCDKKRGDTLQTFKTRLTNQIAPKAEPPNLTLRSEKTIKALWESQEFSDFTIKVEDKEFKVHKTILAANSIVFRQMLNTEMKEKVKNKMKITEFTANVVEEFLHFIYAVGLSNTDENIMDLFAISAKYEVEDLRDFCEQKIRLNLNEENAPDICKMAHLYGRTEMKKEAFAILKKSLEKCCSGIVVDENLLDDPEKLSSIIEARTNFRKILKRKAEDAI